MAGRPTDPLHRLTRDALEPVWMRLDIPTERIAARLGVTRQALSHKARSLGLPPRTGNQRSHQKVDAGTFRRMWLAGVNTSDIAKAFGYSHRAAVSRRRRLMGLPPRQRGAGPCGWDGTISLVEFYAAERGWDGRMTLAEFREAELARLMAQSVRKAA
ncbi:hypothetical protein [Citreimonas sp.]|uniref:hypothetical protein n=1 Tax=Citreimonas sp. TaxID=3036715 RepID=UPI004058B2E5